MRSMTGFGQAKGEDSELGIALRAEISSINRKQFELKCSLPQEVTMYENVLRMQVSEKVTRGALLLRVEVIPCTGSTSADSVNMMLARKLCTAALELQKEFGLERLSDAAAILAIPAVSEGAAALKFGPRLEKLLTSVVARALDNLYEMRTAEGERLRPDLESRLAFLENQLTEIEPFVRNLPKQQYQKLLIRARDAGFIANPSDERFLRELVILTDKSDVTEEIIRLRSHFTHFHGLLAEPKDAIGRTLDFLAQEIFREINTLGNKAPVPEVSRRIVNMKTEVEKIREQVQNVE